VKKKELCEVDESERERRKSAIQSLTRERKEV